MCIGGCHFIFQCINPGSTRAKHGIEGNPCGDFCASCCCGTCVLVQEEKESIIRIIGKDPKTMGNYRSPEGMDYLQFYLPEVDAEENSSSQRQKKTIENEFYKD